MIAHNDVLICSIVAALIFGTAAQAEPVRLACYGKIRFTDFRSGNAVEAPTQAGQSIPLIIDTSAGTIAVEENSPVKLMGQLNDVWVFDARPEDSTQVYLLGTLNRTTGEAEINTLYGQDALHHGFATLRRFEGTCSSQTNFLKAPFTPFPPTGVRGLVVSRTKAGLPSNKSHTPAPHRTRLQV